MDVLTSETCWALKKVIIKQVASSWSLFTQLHAVYILTPERISQGHVQNGRWDTFSWPTVYNCVILSCYRTVTTYFILQLNRTHCVRVTWHWGAFVKQQLQWKSNEHYTTCVCVCSLRYPANTEHNNTNDNIYLLQLGCHPVTVVILHVNKTWNWLLLNLIPEGHMRSM